MQLKRIEVPMERKFGDFSEQVPTQIERDKILEPLEDFCIEVSEGRIFNTQISEIGQFLEVVPPYTRNVVTRQHQALGIFWNSKRYFIQVFRLAVCQSLTVNTLT